MTTMAKRDYQSDVHFSPGLGGVAPYGEKFRRATGDRI
jgi:hypothetical protein